VRSADFGFGSGLEREIVPNPPLTLSLKTHGGQYNNTRIRLFIYLSIHISVYLSICICAPTRFARARSRSKPTTRSLPKRRHGEQYKHTRLHLSIYLSTSISISISLYASVAGARSRSAPTTRSLPNRHKEGGISIPGCTYLCICLYLYLYRCRYLSMTNALPLCSRANRFARITRSLPKQRPLKEGQ